LEIYVYVPLLFNSDTLGSLERSFRTKIISTDLSLLTRIKLKPILKEAACYDVHRIHHLQNRDEWWAFVNTVMNIQLKQRQGIS
jgi:hypothetical protein